MGNGVTVKNTASVTQQDVIDSLTEQLANANERVAIYKRGINKAIEAIEREDDSSAYDAISHLENALQLRKEQSK